MENKTLGQVAFENFMPTGNWEESYFQSKWHNAAQAVVEEVVKRMESVPFSEVWNAWTSEIYFKAGLLAVRNRLVAAARGQGEAVSQPAEIPWTEWHGGPCPLKDDEVEEWEYKTKDGTRIAYPSANPSEYIWQVPSDIIAYRVLKWREGCGPDAVNWKAKHEATNDTLLMRTGQLESARERAEKAESELANVRKLLADANRGAERNAHINQSLAGHLSEVRKELEKSEAELARLQQWKSEQLQVESEWDFQMLAKKLGVGLGQSCRAGIQKAVLALLEQPALSRLRPIAEAGPVPEGCKRFYAFEAIDGWVWMQLATQHNTHYADILLPESIQPAVEAAKSEPETFQAHGKTWTRHTPGDPMPCDGEAMVECLFDGNRLIEPDKGRRWYWGENTTIEAWRYADAQPTPETTPLDMALGGQMYWRDLARQLAEVWWKCHNIGASLQHGNIDTDVSFSVVCERHGGQVFHADTPHNAWLLAEKWLMSPDRANFPIATIQPA